MKTLGKLFFRGLAAILPLALTGYLVYAAVAAAETLLRGLITWLVPSVQYWPGMGFAISIALVLLVGLLMYSFVVRTVYGRITALLNRIPIIKSIYGMLVDVVQVFGSGDKRPFQKVVLVQLAEGGVEMLGFLTRDSFADLAAGFGNDRVAVYLPLSYQIGGVMVLAPRSRVRSIDMAVEAALRLCITAGVTSREPAP